VPSWPIDAIILQSLKTGRRKEKAKKKGRRDPLFALRGVRVAGLGVQLRKQADCRGPDGVCRRGGGGPGRGEEGTMGTSERKRKGKGGRHGDLLLVSHATWESLGEKRRCIIYKGQERKFLCP